MSRYWSHPQECRAIELGGARLVARSNIATFSDEAEALAALKAASSSDGWTSLDDDELASLAGLLARGELVLVRSALPEALEPSCPSMIPRLSDLGE